jgi:uncharacterized protein (DUF1501 family)
MPRTCCTDYSRSELIRQGLARAGEGLPSIEAGMPTPAGTGLSRRAFLARSAGLAMTVYGGAALAPRAFEEGIASAAAAGSSDPVLVNVWLSGGLDTLALLAPVEDPVYRAMRPGLRANPSGNPADVFTEDPRLQWHPNAGPLRDLHLAGKVSVVPGIGWDSSHGSHFVSRHFWEVGDLDEGGRVGWLGRYLDRVGTPDNPLQGISLDTTLSPVIAPGVSPVASLSTPTRLNMGFRQVSGPMATRAFDTAAQLATVEPGDDAIAQGSRALGGLVRLREQLGPIQGLKPTAQGGAVYPSGSYFATQMQLVVEMLAAGLPMRCITVQGPGGYDTHSSQNGILPGNLDVLSKTLGAFQADLEARGMANRVLVHVWSEFGRRLAENGGGTDHGAAGVSLLIGERVRGTMVGELPSLGSLDSLGNLKATADFRGLYCSILEQWLGTEADGIVPGASSFARPQIIRA